jgi:hypothetical protein
MYTNTFTVKIILRWRANAQDCIFYNSKNTHIDTNAELIF